LTAIPILMGSDGGILSMPPIINSADIGAVQVGDTDILVEFTGTDMQAVCLSANIVACDFADAGYEIKPVLVDYSFDTPFGRSVTFPYYFQAPAAVDAGKVTKLLGDSIGPDKAAAALGQDGHPLEPMASMSAPGHRNTATTSSMRSISLKT
jgi:phenylalanyl-tRNA synthetase beta chain